MEGQIKGGRSEGARPMTRDSSREGVGAGNGDIEGGETGETLEAEHSNFYTWLVQ